MESRSDVTGVLWDWRPWAQALTADRACMHSSIACGVMGETEVGLSGKRCRVFLLLGQPEARCGRLVILAASNSI